MTLQSTPLATTPSDSFWLTPYREGLLECLAAQGYTWRTIKTFRRLASRICAEAESRGIGPDSIDEQAMTELAGTCPRTGTSYMERELSMVRRRFTGYLIDVGVIEPSTAPLPVPGSSEQVCAELDHWLRHHRGMFGSRLPVYRNVLTQFMAFSCKSTGTAEDLASLSPETVFAFLDGNAGKTGWRITFVRNILRFLFWSGRAPRDLSGAIPRSASGPPPDGLPRHLDAETVRRLLEAACSNRPSGLRNYAMFLLMARLGLRGQEVTAIRLEDIDWRGGRILIRGKGGQPDHMPLPVDVGEAIVAWLQWGRNGDSRHMFVSVYPPYRPITASSTLRGALLEAWRRAGLTPPRGRVRTHALRHGLAMDLLGRGASLEEIGDVLRHRCAESTTVYARHDLKALRPLARPWPVPGGTR